MSQFSSVAWKEGMFLLPQHFQQCERSLLNQFHTRFQAKSPLSWGLLDLEIDRVALAQGQVSLTRIQGILPDGTVLQCPENEPTPPPRAFEFPTDKNEVQLFVTLPLGRAGAPALTKDKNRLDIRHIEADMECFDTSNPSRSDSIQIANKNLRLSFGHESRDGLISLEIARIVRNDTGNATLSQSFIPPCLQVNVCKALLDLARDTLGQLSARASSLAAERRQRGNNNMDFNATDIQSFWFLHTLNTHVGALRHRLEIPGTHPSELYLELLKIAGSLSTFALEEGLELPPYRHTDLERCFNALTSHIQSLMPVFAPLYEIIPLSRRENYWHGQIPKSCTGQFILVARGIPHEEAVKRLPRVLKMANPDAIGRLVRLAIGGIPISPMTTPPTTVPLRSDSTYFHIHPGSDDWKQVMESRQIAAYVPAILPGIKLQIIVLKEQR